MLYPVSHNVQDDRLHYRHLSEHTRQYVENWKVSDGQELTHPAAVTFYDKKKSDSHSVQLEGDADVHAVQFEDHYVHVLSVELAKYAVGQF